MQNVTHLTTGKVTKKSSFTQYVFMAHTFKI